MKIAVLGNTNNYPFMLALALRRQGHEVTIYLDSKERLHSPSSYIDPSKFNGIELRDISGLINKYYQYLFFPPALRKLKKELQQYDAIIANGLWPIVAKAVRLPYLILLTGSDLELYASAKAFIKYSWQRQDKENLAKRVIRVCIAALVAGHQAAAIKNATAFNYFLKGVIPKGDALLARINPEAAVRLGFMMTDTSRFEYRCPPQNKRIRILLTARQTWQKPLKPGTTILDYKGTDIFLEGLALFVQRYPQELEVVLVRKGLDVAASEKLVKSLGLDPYVIWNDEMSQQQLFSEIINADIVADQFALSVVGMAGLDAMALGRPLIANGRPEIFRQEVGEDSPICQASTAEEVCNQLEKLRDPAVREEIGRVSRNYVVRNFSSDNAAKVCVESLNQGRHG
jgi:glycosyltransferase involved in cell wall biosynthesis